MWHLRVQKLVGLCSLLVVVVACDSTTFWERSTKLCNPLQSDVIAKSRRWDETFAKTGVPACLRISWGSEVGQSKGFYVRLEQSGAMSLYQKGNQQFESELRFTLPSDVRERERSFRLFAFGAGVKREEQNDFCTRLMSRPEYVCQKEEQGACWFWLAFQPSSTSGLRAAPVKDTCQMGLPSEAAPARKPKSFSTLRASSSKFGAGLSVAIAADESVVFAGQFQQNLTLGGDTLSTTAVQSGFIAKVDAQGQLAWVTGVLGSDSKASASVKAVQIGPTGDIFAAGTFERVVKIGNRTEAAVNASNQIFIARFDTEGKMVWFRQAGGDGSDFVRSMVVSPAGEIFVVGGIHGSPVFGRERFQTSSTVSSGFIASLSADGDWRFANVLFGTKQSVVDAIAVNQSGKIAVTGSFSGKVSFDDQLVTSFSQAMFVGGISAENGKWTWTKTSGGAGPVNAGAVGIDRNGVVYATGYFDNSVAFGKDVYSGESGVLYIAKVSQNRDWEWVSVVKSPSTVKPTSLTLDELGHPYVSGHFTGLTKFGDIQVNTTGALYNAFVAKLNPKGQWEWVERASDITSSPHLSVSNALDVRSGRLFLTGSFVGQVRFGEQTYQSVERRSHLFLWGLKL